MTFLHLHQLHFGYGEQPVLRDCSHAFSPGVALLRGGDGVGKTTLLRMVAGHLVPQQGSVRLRGAPVQPTDVFWIDPRQPGVDVQQTPAQWLAGQPTLAQAALACHIEGLGLAPHLDKGFFMLSTGTQRKVSLAAALASRAPLVLIDEPVAGLDKASITALQAALAACAADRTRLVLVAHYEPLAGVPWGSVCDLGG